MVDAQLQRSKYPDEEFVIAWDFTDDLDTDESITDVAVDGTRVEAVDQDGDDVSDDVLEGANVFERQLRVRLKAGADGDNLAVRFIAVTSAGSQFERVVAVRVRA